MKIVMLGDCAYVGYELRKELKCRGLKVEHWLFNHRSRRRYARALVTPFKLALSDCGLVHAHYLRFPAYAAYLSGKPYIVHIHGSDVRYGVGKFKRQCIKRARKILVSTSDLLEFVPEATYLPNPVGPQFCDYGLEKKGAAYFRKPFEDPPKIDWLDYTILEGNFSYKEMPDILNKFEYIVDDGLPALSKTSLEALACGCKVVGWDGRILEGLPHEHRVENVVKRLLQIYDEVLT